MPLLAPAAVAAGTLSAQPQPTLTAGALTLRPFRLDDVPALVEIYADPAIQRWHVQSLTPPEAREWISRRQQRWSAESAAEWAVTVGSALVGRMGLNRLDLEQGVGEIAYWTAPEHRGRGYASAALELVGGWAFTLGIGRLELLHSVHNAGSCAVAGRAGYALEGVKRHAGLHADGWHDMHLHARVAADDPMS